MKEKQQSRHCFSAHTPFGRGLPPPRFDYQFRLIQGYLPFPWCDYLDGRPDDSGLGNRRHFSIRRLEQHVREYK